ncbi:MAG: ABC transporter ATP-binding protein [bacterium]|nr:ABC transporter ATP-binding protein [bacterium]
MLKYLRPYISAILFLITATVGGVAATLKLPDFTARIINEGIIGGHQDIIVPVGLQMLGIALVGGIFTIITGYLSARIGTGFSRDLRAGLFTKVERFSLVEMNTFSPSSLITRTTNDIQQVQTVLVMVMRMVLAAPITAIWALYKANAIAPDMSWIMALAITALLAVVITLFVLVIPKFQLVQKLTDKLNLVSRENITGIRVIRAFDNQHNEADRLKKVNTDLTKTNIFVARATALMQPVMFLILNLVSVVIVWSGAHLIGTYVLEIGDMLAFMQYAIQVIFSFLMITIVFIMVPRALVSGKRILEVLSVDPIIKDPITPKETKQANGVLVFNDVTFGYDQADVPILENISFTAQPGQVTAIIGSTGSGKSTLINLVPRFYDTLFGEITIDGVNITEMSQHQLRSIIGYVPQKSVIFSGTIHSNIAYSNKTANTDDIHNAARIAQADEFISLLPKAYETPISQYGTNLSGGQKQRISIARAITKDPSIYIFDDTFSALDYKTEVTLRHELKKVTKQKTVLIVAQRVNTILHADQIIVLDKGKNIGQGTHQELMKTCSVYQEIAKSQLSEDELNKYL